MAELSQAQLISIDIIAKLQQALENEDALSQDELFIMLSEALDVINELVALADRDEES